MSYAKTMAVLLTGYLAVFAQSAAAGPRAWVGVQIDLLPALVVYCGLSAGLITLTLLAVCGGLCFDALSANPLGVTVLPLFLAGFIIQWNRDLILRDQYYARFILGVAASAGVPIVTLVLLWGSGYKPLLGWHTLWQWGLAALIGGLLTPLCFRLFERLDAALNYNRPIETTFRPDREIKRGPT